MVTGVFGKLPVHGDFIARGLTRGVQPVVDRWLTQVLAPYTHRPDAWPPEGLRGLIAHRDGPLALLILPSRDATGRAFPLAAVTPGNGAGQCGIDSWAGQVLPILQRACRGGLNADQLIAALAPAPAPAPALSASAGMIPPLLWAVATTPQDPLAFVAAMTAGCGAVPSSG